MYFSKRFAISIFAVSTFLTPINIVQAQEKACVAVTEIDSAGQIIWSESPDIAELVEDAQKLEISPADYKELCGGEEVIEEASDKKPEEDKEKPEELAAEETTPEQKVDVEKTASAAESSGIGWGGAVLGGLAAAAAGGGGGGGGGGISDGTYRNTISGSYGTEYNAQAGLANINALGLNDYGYTGSGVKVAVVDSGIDQNHAEFNSRTIYGYDFSSSASGYGSDENGHGSHVASIIAGDRDSSGMRGVAYDATLYDYKWLDSSGSVSFNDTTLTSLINRHVSDGIDVSNNSWGVSTRVNGRSSASVRSSYTQSIAALKTAQSNGTLFVFAAGNNGAGAFGAAQPNLIAGMPYHDSALAGAWLVVVSVSPTLTETRYTDRCGVTYDFCVTAPGGGDNQNSDGIYAAQTNGSYVRYSGTSMAAPHVSGLAAALMEKFPSLTPAQIATRIKSTASYTGLTGYSGQTSANSSTAVMQAIFGHGLVNANAASARIGSYVYANGSNLNNGQNLNVSKLSLPASLPASTQNQILGSKFIVFDSFDGARFSVGGNEVFEASHSSIARTYGTTKIIDTHSKSELSFISSGQKIYPSKWAPRYIMSGNSNEMIAAEGFWGETASMLSSQPFVKGQASTNFIWAHSYRDFAIQPFIQIQDETASSQSIGSYGASFQLNLSDGLKAVTGYKISNHLFDNGILSGAASAGSARDFEVGFKQEISPSKNLFLRFLNTQIDDIAASDKTFGFKNVTANSWTFGYETKNNLGKFTFGVSSPSKLSNGTVSLMTPSGRTKSGDVLYTETEFAISRDNKMERFIAYQYEKGELAISFGVVEDRYNYGKIGAAKLDISMPF